MTGVYSIMIPLRPLSFRYLVYNIVELIVHLLPYVAWAGERTPFYCGTSVLTDASDFRFLVFSAWRVYALTNRHFLLAFVVFLLTLAFIIPNIVVRD